MYRPLLCVCYIPPGTTEIDCPINLFLLFLYPRDNFYFLEVFCIFFYKYFFLLFLKKLFFFFWCCKLQCSSVVWSELFRVMTGVITWHFPYIFGFRIFVLKIFWRFFVSFLLRFSSFIFVIIIFRVHFCSDGVKKQY